MVNVTAAVLEAAQLLFALAAIGAFVAAVSA